MVLAIAFVIEIRRFTLRTEAVFGQLNAKVATIASAVGGGFMTGNAVQAWNPIQTVCDADPEDATGCLKCIDRAS